MRTQCDRISGAVRNAMHVRTERTKNSAHSHLDRYRFLTANRRETTGNGVGSAR